MAIRIVTDSSADLPAELVRQRQITVLPSYVMMNGVSYQDGVNLLHDDFYRRLVSMDHPPTTAQPSISDFQSAYSALLEEGHQILSIHLSGKLSGTLNSAEQAKSALGADASIRIIDSQLASIPLGLVALSAAEAAENAESLQDLSDHVRVGLPLSEGFFLLDTLEFLEKGGRIGKAQAFLGSVLRVKPILKIVDGEAHPVERPRTQARAMARLLELARQLAPAERVAVIYSTEEEAAHHLRRNLADLAPEEEIIMARFGPTLGTYVGPGALGIALIRRAL
jgi:DegV family protein with EDD domain